MALWGTFLKKVAAKMHFLLQILSSFVIFFCEGFPTLGTCKIRIHMDKEKMENTIEDGVCSSENKNVKKKPWKPDYKEPPFWDEFRPLWGPGSKYKPWIN